MINDLVSLLDPVSVEDFTQARANRDILHVPASQPSRYRDLMNWDVSSDLIERGQLPGQNFCLNHNGTRVPDVDDIIRPTIDVFGTTLDLRPEVRSILRLFKTSATLSVGTICETLPYHQALSLIEAVQTLDRAGIVNLKAPRRV